MKTVALFGGSFDPPHRGHAQIIYWLCTQKSLDISEVWVLPTVHHAFGKELQPYEVRERMIQRMLQDEAFLASLGNDPYEIRRQVHIVRREEPFMVDTLTALRAENPDTKFLLVLGTDIYSETGQWARWDEVQTLASPLWIHRPGVKLPTGELLAFNAGMPPISSTDIRDRLSQGDMTYLTGEGADLAESVFNLIRAKKLYGWSDPPEPSPEVLIKEVDIEVSDLQDIYPPGSSFALKGYIRQVLGVLPGSSPNGSIVFQVLWDTTRHQKYQADLADWHRQKTRARFKGTEFSNPEPIPMSPILQYLKYPGDPVTQGMFFWTHDQPASGYLGLGIF